MHKLLVAPWFGFRQDSYLRGCIFDTNFTNEIREEITIAGATECERRLTAPVLLGSHIRAAVYSFVS